MKNIVVIGSANMDTANYLENFPDELTAENDNGIKESKSELGGKGLNQAISAKRQGEENVKVYFVGNVGKDEEGIKILEALKSEGIDYSGVKVLDEKTDGRIIFVDKNGENRMTGYGECIKKLKPEMLQEEKIAETLSKADFIMIQMKMPKETVGYVVKYCQEHNKRILVDPTPLKNSSYLFEKKLMDKIDYLTPNEEEAYALALYSEGYTYEKIEEMYKKETPQRRVERIRKLILKFPNIIATMGENGVLYENNGIVNLMPANKTRCVDSTGAGDTFNGALVAALMREKTLKEAIEIAQMASTINVEHKGAQKAPNLAETEERLEKTRQAKLH